MRLHTDSKSFLSALDLASNATDSKMPILTCALIECREDGEVTVTCDSLDQRITTSFSGAKVESAFSFVASPKMLKASMRADESTLTLRDGKLHIESGGKSSIFTMDVKEFPAPWAPIMVNPFEAAKFLSALKHVASCANPDADNLDNCAMWEKTSGHLLSIGTPGRSSLCVHPMPLGFGDNFCLPVVCAKSIGSIFDADDSFAIGLSGGVLHIQEGGVMAWFKTIDLKIPNHTAILVQEPASASIQRDYLIRAFDALEAFSDSEGQWVQVSGNDGAWSASALNTQGESSIPIEGVEEIQPLDAFIVSRSAVSRFLRGLTADVVEVRRDARALMLTPCDESGVMGVFGMRRKDMPTT